MGPPLICILPSHNVSQNTSAPIRMSNSLAMLNSGSANIIPDGIRITFLSIVLMDNL